MREQGEGGVRGRINISLYVSSLYSLLPKLNSLEFTKDFNFWLQTQRPVLFHFLLNKTN